MRRNIPAAEIIDWADRQIKAALAEANKPMQMQQIINQQNSRMAAFYEVKSFCEALQDREKEEN